MAAVKRKHRNPSSTKRKRPSSRALKAQPIDLKEIEDVSAPLANASRRNAPQHKRPLWVRFLRRIRSYLLTGLVVAMPLVITFYIANWFIGFVDNQILPLSARLMSPEVSEMVSTIPGLGLAIAVILLILLGWFAANIFGQTLIRFGERIVDRMPIIRTIYHALKQIFQMVLSRRSSNFREVGLIEYPRPGVHAIVFVAKALSGEISDKIKKRKGDEIMAVFLPTTPNPTSGFLLFLPRRKVIKLDMSVESGIKMVVSGALLEPEAMKSISRRRPSAKSSRGSA